MAPDNRWAESGEWRSFIASSECITSAPGVAFLAGEHAALQGGVSVCFRVPQRVYVGLEVIGRGGPATSDQQPVIDFERGDHRAYDPAKGEWVRVKWDVEKETGRAHSKHSFDRALDRVASNLTSLPGRRITVHSRQFLRPSAGCNWSGAFSTALVAAMHVLARRLDPTVVSSWATLPGAELVAAGECFDQCHRDAWRVENAFHGGKASGYGTFCALIGGPDPIVYVTVERDRPGPFADGTGPYPVALKTEDESLLDEIPYAGARLVDLLPSIVPAELRSGIDHFPGFAIAIVFSGKKKNTSDAINVARDELTAQLRKAAEWTLEMLERPEFAVLPNDTLVQGLAGFNGEDLRGFHMRALLGNGLAVLRNLYQLYDLHPDADEARLVEEFAASVRRVHGSLSQIGLDWPEFYPIARTVYDCAERLGWFESTAVKLTGAGKGGCVVCVVPKDGDLLDELETRLNHLAAGNPEVNVDWLSWHGGEEKEGLRIERVADSAWSSASAIPSALRVEYSSTAVRFVPIEIGPGPVITRRACQLERCGPSDLASLRGERIDDAVTCDLFVDCNLSLGEGEIYVWGVRVDLTSPSGERHGSRPVLALALAALSQDRMVRLSDAFKLASELWPRGQSGAGWSPSYIRRGLIKPLEEHMRRVTEGRGAASRPYPRLRTERIDPLSPTDLDINSNLVLDPAGVRSGTLWIAVANCDPLDEFLANQRRRRVAV